MRKGCQRECSQDAMRLRCFCPVGVSGRLWSTSDSLGMTYSESLVDETPRCRSQKQGASDYLTSSWWRQAIWSKTVSDSMLQLMADARRLHEFFIETAQRVDNISNEVICSM